MTLDTAPPTARPDRAGEPGKSGKPDKPDKAGKPDKPLRRDAERNRQRILAAAREVFGTRGLEATLDDIAHHAGLGVGTVYRRFPSKEHLVEAMFVDELEDIAQLAERALAEPDGWQGFVQFIWHVAELNTTNRGLREVMLSNAFGQQHVAKAKAKIIPTYIELFRRAQQSGQLRADMHETDLPILQLMLGSVAEYSSSVEPNLWRRYLTIFLDGMRVQIAPRTDLPHRALDQDELQQVMSTWNCPGSNISR